MRAAGQGRFVRSDAGVSAPAAGDFATSGSRPRGLRGDMADVPEEGNVADVVKELTDETFQQTVDGATTPVIVDFWAAWCGPCRTVAPIVEDLAGTHADKVTVGKLNVDENQATAAKFGIMSIPTLILFKDGKPVKKVIGVRSKGDLEREFELA
jgi:thioredoxin 1